MKRVVAAFWVLCSSACRFAPPVVLQPKDGASVDGDGGDAGSVAEDRALADLQDVERVDLDLGADRSDLALFDAALDAGLDGQVDGPADVGPDVGQDAAPDAGFLDLGPAPDATAFPYSPANFDPLLLPAPRVRFEVGEDETCVVDTSSLTFSGCGSINTSLLMPVIRSQLLGGPEVVVIGSTSMLVDQNGTIEVVGRRPLILAVFGDVRLDGTVRADAVGVLPGPGGDDPGFCSGGTGRPGGPDAVAGGGGGGGGSHQNIGGIGGDAVTAAGGPAGSNDGSAENEPLRAGCAGGRGGNGMASAGGAGGAGGGAVQISAAGMIDIGGAEIQAGGGGGRGAANTGGGGGGGSGGAILFEGQDLNLSGNTTINANGGGGGGGGGGSGSGFGSAGGNGSEGSPGSLSASGGGGGLLGGAGGGSGLARLSNPFATDGGDISGLGGPGGGGGGGAGFGWIRFNAHGGTCSISGGVSVSPAATSNGASGCP